MLCRDIKPENMLLAPLPEGQQAQGPSRWQLKVVDYGCSTFCMPGQKLHEAVGTVSSRAQHDTA
jgi:serine/threonine protein kinase